MGSLDDARAHLAKAREFLHAAEVSLEGGWYSAAASNAVLSGINAKDAVCLKLTGATTRTEGHRQAVTELEKAGPAAAKLTALLDRLLGVKNKAQYQTRGIAASEAEKAVERALELYAGAAEIVSG
jgi:uncharacterized protein (UPF0332 family)